MDQDTVEIEIPSGAERRQHPRYPTQIEVGMEISLSEDRIHACEGPVQLVDASLRGIKIHVNDFEYEIYRELMKSQRGIKVYLDDESGENPMELKGMAVWIDFHMVKGAKQKGSLNLGISLKFRKNDTTERYEHFIARFKK